MSQLHSFPKTPIPNNAKSYFTGSFGSKPRNTSLSSSTAPQSVCFRSNKPKTPGHPIHMYIQRNQQLPRRNPLPNPKIHSFIVFPHHPAQKHIQAFAGGAAQGRGDVLTRTIRRIWQSKKQLLKTRQRSLGIRRSRGEVPCKSIFQVNHAVGSTAGKIPGNTRCL